MTREEAVGRLREHQAELMAGGIVQLYLFGSTARGAQRPDSDIDLVATFDEKRRISLLGVAGLELTLAQLLGRPVDLVEEAAIKPRIRRNIEAEALRVF